MSARLSFQLKTFNVFEGNVWATRRMSLFTFYLAISCPNFACNRRKNRPSEHTAPTAHKTFRSASSYRTFSATRLRFPSRRPSACLNMTWRPQITMRLAYKSFVTISEAAALKLNFYIFVCGHSCQNVFFKLITLILMQRRNILIQDHFSGYLSCCCG